MSASLTSSSNAAGIFSNIGNLVSGIGSLVQGKDEERQGEYGAKIYEQQAQATRTSQDLLESQKRRLIKSRIGEQTAGYAAGGVKMSGSAIEVMLESLTNAELDISIDKYNSEVQARGYESQAGMTRYEGRQAKAKSYTRAGMSFLGSAADIYKSQKEVGSGRINKK